MFGMILVFIGLIRPDCPYILEISHTYIRTSSSVLSALFLLSYQHINFVEISILVFLYYLLAILTYTSLQTILTQK